jgi:hypothetical protein
MPQLWLSPAFSFASARPGSEDTGASTVSRATPPPPRSLVTSTIAAPRASPVAVPAASSDATTGFAELHVKVTSVTG